MKSRGHEFFPLSQTKLKGLLAREGGSLLPYIDCVCFVPSAVLDQGSLASLVRFLGKHSREMSNPADVKKNDS